MNQVELASRIERGAPGNVEFHDSIEGRPAYD